MEIFGLFPVVGITRSKHKIAALTSGGATWQNLAPAFYPGKSKLEGVLVVVAVAPWAHGTMSQSVKGV